MTHRAYATLELKAHEGEARVVTGLASTPSLDHAGDIVEPAGAVFSLPLPLLRHHDPAAPIGHVNKAKITTAGIEIEAQLVKVDEPGALRERLETAWQEIKSGLVRGLSIGFVALESARIEGSAYGRRFTKWRWLELSAVTIPANFEASIARVKALDLVARQDAGQPGPNAARVREVMRAARADLSAKGGEKAGVSMALLVEGIEVAALGVAGMLDDEVAALHERLAALESAERLKYCGVYDPAVSYRPGDFVTVDGSMWHARVAVKGVRPGAGAAAWQLAVKHGRDGRDAVGARR